MNNLAPTHPANAPVAQSMRAVEYVRRAQWCHGDTYKVHFDRSVPTEEIERFLDQLEADYGLTPTDEQVTGNNLMVERETAPSEENEESV